MEKIIAGGSRRKFLGFYLHMVKKLSLAEAGKKFFVVIFNMVKVIAGGSRWKILMVILHMGKNNCGKNFEGYFPWAKNYCWWQPAKCFRVLSSYGKNIITGGSRRKLFRGYFHKVKNYYWRHLGKNFKGYSSCGEKNNCRR